MGGWRGRMGKVEKCGLGFGIGDGMYLGCGKDFFFGCKVG